MKIFWCNCFCKINVWFVEGWWLVATHFFNWFLQLVCSMRGRRRILTEKLSNSVARKYRLRRCPPHCYHYYYEKNPCYRPRFRRPRTRSFAETFGRGQSGTCLDCTNRLETVPFALSTTFGTPRTLSGPTHGCGSTHASFCPRNAGAGYSGTFRT